MDSLKFVIGKVCGMASQVHVNGQPISSVLATLNPIPQAASSGPPGVQAEAVGSPIRIISPASPTYTQSCTELVFKATVTQASGCATSTTMSGHSFLIPATKKKEDESVGSSKTCNWVLYNGQVCGKTFAKAHNLVVHMRVHEDYRPFSCSFCDKMFRQKSHLNNHERRTHGEFAWSTQQTSSSSIQPGNFMASIMPTTDISANLQQPSFRESEQFDIVLDNDTVAKNEEDEIEAPFILGV